MKTLDPAHASRIATAIDQVNRAVASGLSPAAVGGFHEARELVK